MIQNRRITVVVMMSTFVLSTVSVFAAPAGGGFVDKKAGIERMENRRQQLLKSLDLSDGQKKLLEENKNKYRQQIKALRQEIRGKRELLQQGLEKDELNMAEIERLRGELKASKVQMDDLRFESILAARKILTTEQFKKFMHSMESRKKGGRHAQGGEGEEPKSEF
jgi:Spy/CpxP family protein refolding chaperone